MLWIEEQNKANAFRVISQSVEVVDLFLLKIT